MTTIFAFDTATTTACCALLRDGQALAERHCKSSDLLAAAADLLRETGVTFGDLDGLVVGTGPGSFTSIRIGLATARGLCFALGDLPAAGASSLHAYAGGRAVIDARRGEVFSNKVFGKEVCGDGARAVRPDELEVAGEVLVGDGALRYRELFERAGAQVPGDGDPRHLPSAALLAGRAGTFASAALLEPLYLREPDAVASR